MPMKVYRSLHPSGEELIAVNVDEEEEEGGDNLFDPEAGRASEDPFAHLALEDAPDSAASDEEVSEYVAGDEEE